MADSCRAPICHTCRAVCHDPVFYNSGRSMRHLPVRPLVALLLSLCVWTVFTAPSHGQQTTATTLTFPASAWAALAHGKPAEAETLARARPADDPAAVAVLAHITVERGGYDEAIAALRPAAARAPLSDAALELGLLQQRLGRTADASPLLNTIYRQSPEDPVSRLRAARAASALGRAREANGLFHAAAAFGPDPAVDTGWGLLFLEKYNRPEAVKSFKQALSRDDLWAPAHAGLARTLAEDNPPAAAAAAQRALEIDPHLADAELLLAELDLDNTHYTEARERIDRVLAWNPAQLDAIALSAAIKYVRGDTSAWEKDVARALAINPSFGEIYRAAAELSARNYRFDEAVSLAQQATTLDPTNARAHAELGMHLMRTGDEPAARVALDRAFKIDAFDTVTYNLLALLDSLDKFVEIREGDIILKLDPAEAPVMREYAMPLAQNALKTLSAKYNFTPKGPILVEVFPRHDDFAVRTLGLPGMLGALGACFGRVVTLDSPHAREPGSFSWQATLWHEMTHVITLQMSQQRIPRWLTEGISEYEEGQAHDRVGPGNGSAVRACAGAGQGAQTQGSEFRVHQSRDDCARLLRGLAPRRPHRPHLREREAAGPGALVRRRGGGERGGREGDGRVHRRAANVVRHVARRTFRSAARRASRGARRPRRCRRPARRTWGRGVRPRQLRARASAHPGNYAAQLAYGQALAAAGDRAAFEPLEKAAALVPLTSGEDTPHALMARLAEQLGDTTRAIAEYKAVLAQDHTTVEAARRLAALVEKSAPPSPRRSRSRTSASSPSTRSILPGTAVSAGSRVTANDAPTAVREFKAALALGPADRAGAHCDLAEALLLASRPSEAKSEALAALEIAPSYDRAQELLLRAIQGAGPAGARQ